MARELATAFVSIIPSFRGAEATIRRELSGIGGRAGDQAGDDFGRHFGTSAKRGLDSSGLRSSIAGIAKGVALVGLGASTAALGIAGFAIKSAADIEQVQVAFTSLLGSSSAASDQIKELQAFAAKTPFAQQDVFGYAQQYFALADSVGLAKDQVIPFLTTIGDVGAVTGASTEAIHNAVLAIGQIGSAGKVTLENLNQISEAFPGFNGAAAIAAATGQTTAEVMQQISKGELSAAQGIPALLDGMKKFNGAAGAMAKQSQTLNGLFSTFADTVKISLTQSFQALIPTVKTTLGSLTTTIQGTLSTLAPQISKFVQNLAPALGPLIEGLASVLGSVLDALGPALVALTPVIKPFADAVVALVQASAPLLQILAEIAAGLAPLLKMFADIAPILVPAIIGFKLFTSAVGGVQSALTKIQTNAATSLSGLNGIVTALGIGFAFAAKGLSDYAAAQAATKARIEGLTAAFQADTLAVGENTRTLIVSQLEQSGALKAAQTLGISLNLVTDAALGQKNAQRQLAAQIKNAVKGTFAQNQAALKLRILTAGANTELERAESAARREADAAGHAASATAVLGSTMGLAIGNALGFGAALGVVVAAASRLASIGGALGSKFAAALPPIPGIGTGIGGGIAGGAGTAGQVDQVSGAVQRLHDQVVALRDAIAQEASTVAGAVRGSFNIANVTASFGEPVTLTDIKNRLATAVANAKRFINVLKRLAREGLSRFLIQQLAEAGPDALPQAQALLSATPKEIRQINSEFKQLSDIASSTGHFAANEFFKTGVLAAQGLANGMKSEKSALLDAIRSLANSMVAELRRTLGIHSPSRVGTGIGSNFGLSVAAGLDAQHAAVQRSAARLLNAGTPRAQLGRWNAAGTGVGNTYNVELHAHNPLAEPLSRMTPAMVRQAAYALGRS